MDPPVQVRVLRPQPGRALCCKGPFSFRGCEVKIMGEKGTVVVGMSGGVDSSVAAALLVRQGYRVIGVMLRLWAEPGCEHLNRCCTPEAMLAARQVAHQLGIPFYVYDVRQVFYRTVVQAFFEGYAKGWTPNPCLVCNAHIRWGALLTYAQRLGADFFATGHYARVRRLPDGRVQLLRGVDRKKDQSYVLSVLTQDQLQRTLLPVGEYTKEQVREMAEAWGLPVAHRRESQDLCFLAGEDYRSFLARHRPDLERPGPILTLDGRIVGMHRGLAFYTIGQRRGLGLGGGEPLYVIAKDPERNALIVGPKSARGRRGLVAGDVVWTLGQPPADSSFRGEVQIRYRAQAVPATVTLLEQGKGFRVVFDEPVWDVTPGQRAVLYQGEVCLGGGTIHQVLEDIACGEESAVQEAGEVPG